MISEPSITQGGRLCRHCNCVKDLSEFYPSLPSKCRGCKRSQQTTWRKRTAPTRAAYWRDYRRARPEQVAQYQRAYYEQNKDASLRKGSRRRALKAGGSSEPYDRWHIFERDLYVCQLCSGLIDMILI